MRYNNRHNTIDNKSTSDATVKSDLHKTSSTVLLSFNTDYFFFNGFPATSQGSLGNGWWYRHSQDRVARNVMQVTRAFCTALGWMYDCPTWLWGPFYGRRYKHTLMFIIGAALFCLYSRQRFPHFPSCWTNKRTDITSLSWRRETAASMNAPELTSTVVKNTTWPSPWGLMSNQTVRLP